MPLREYEAEDPKTACSRCRPGFERLETAATPVLESCPHCGRPVRRRISAPAVGASVSGLDRRARQAGFHKLKRLGRGEYEKAY